MILKAGTPEAKDIVAFDAVTLVRLNGITQIDTDTNRAKQWAMDGTTVLLQDGQPYEVDYPNPVGIEYLAMISNFLQNQTTTVGSNLSFTIQPNASKGTEPFHFQWKRDSTDVGTDSDTLNLNSITTNDAGYYKVMVTDSSTPPKLSARRFNLTVNP